MGALATMFLNQLTNEKNMGINISNTYYARVLINYYFIDQDFSFLSSPNQFIVNYTFSPRPEFVFVIDFLENPLDDSVSITAEVSLTFRILLFRFM